MQNTLELIDSHAHIDLETYDSDRDDVLKRAQESGVKHIINILMGPDTDKIEKALNLSERYDFISYAIGIHPHDADQVNEKTLNLLRPYFDHPKVIAVGEIGLDYYYENSSISAQKKCFRQWIDFALERKLPISVHTRDAFEDTVRIVKETNIFEKTGGVIHCFTGNLNQAKAYLDLGAMISFSGIVTFKNATAIAEAAKYVPLDRILIETDCPFLAPIPYRGKRNEPSYVTHVAECIASLKGETLKTIAHASFKNFKNLFHL